MGIFRGGYHFLLSRIVAQETVRSFFAPAQVNDLLSETEKLRVSGEKYFSVRLPFSVVVAAKPCIQNKAFEYVCPPDLRRDRDRGTRGMTSFVFARAIQPFRLSTVATVALHQRGGLVDTRGMMSFRKSGFL